MQFTNSEDSSGRAGSLVLSLIIYVSAPAGIYNVAGRPVALFPRPIVPFLSPVTPCPFVNWSALCR